jgi:hypothetical protein
MENEFLNARKILYVLAFLIFGFATYIVFKDVLFSNPEKNNPTIKDAKNGVAFNPPSVGDINQTGKISIYSSTNDQQIYSLNDDNDNPIFILKSADIDLSLSSGSNVEILGRINGRLDGIGIIEITSIKYK